MADVQVYYENVHNERGNFCEGCLVEYILFNPKTDFWEKICKEIWKNGFIEYGVISGGERKYRKGEAEIYITLCQDDVGAYIVMFCQNISGEKLRDELVVCPECGSDQLQVVILPCWRSAVTEKLYEEGKLEYGPGAYDRIGTCPETHKCLNCGCKWHNGAAMYYWNERAKEHC